MRQHLAALLALMFLFCSTSTGANVVISEVYRTLGSPPIYQRSYIELFNSSSFDSVSLENLTVQIYNGTQWNVVTTLSGSLDPHQFLLIATGGTIAGGAEIPTPDFTGLMSPSPFGSVVAIVDSTTALPAGPPDYFYIKDLLGYGSGAYTLGLGAPPLSVQDPSLQRKLDGCYNVFDNSTDFELGYPSPKSKLSPPGTCTPTDTNVSVDSQSTVVPGCLDTTSTLVVYASGAPTIEYQWRRDGLDLSDDSIYSGTQTPVLILMVNEDTLTGEYTCFVSNTWSSAETTTTTLVLYDLPEITQDPVGGTFVVGETLSLSVTLSEGGGSVRWYREGTPLVDDTRTFGSFSSFLQIAGLQTTDSGEYTCELTTNCGEVYSLPAQVNVLPKGTLYGPQDHAGADLILGQYDRIWGLHQNVGRFEVPAGVTVLVEPYDGTEKGSFEVQAQVIDIAGTINATGAGYTGGGGGGTGGPAYCIIGVTGFGGSGGPARYGITSRGNPGSDNGGCGGTSAGGAGGNGDGPFAGAGGSGGHPSDCGYWGSAAGAGGYAAAAGNGDESTDESLLMGSGGGGAGGQSGGGLCALTGGVKGGDAGGSGGGIIRLVAANSFTLGSQGKLLADGTRGGRGTRGPNGAGGNAAYVSYLAEQSGSGGPGAGGGILIDVRGATTATIEAGAEVRSVGGPIIPTGLKRNSTIKSGATEYTNGGTIKVRDSGNLVVSPGASFAGGRGSGIMLTTEVNDWHLY